MRVIAQIRAYAANEKKYVGIETSNSARKETEPKYSEMHAPMVA